VAGTSVLVVQAHPDDMEYHCGSTIASRARNGDDVRTLILTDGGKGTYKRDLSTKELAEIRHREAQESADILGLNEVIWFGYPDGELPYSLELRDRVIEVIRRLRPDIVMLLDPWLRYEVHPDHRNAGLITAEAAVFANFPLFNPGQGKPHLVKEVWFYATDRPNHFVDAAPYLALKKRAMLAHKSQVEMLGYMAKWSGTVSPRLSDFAAGKKYIEMNFMKNMSRYREESGFELAEAYHVCRAEAGHLDIS